jgi:hypothetical protein
VIWDWLVRQDEKHPVLMRRLTALLVGMFVLYLLFGWVGSYLTEQGRQGCETSNAGRLGALREATGKKTTALVQEGIYTARHDEQMAKTSHEEVEVFEKRISDLISSAEASGHQNTAGAVTIACAAEWPTPIPWFEGGS